MRHRNVSLVLDAVRRSARAKIPGNTREAALVVMALLVAALLLAGVARTGAASSLARTTVPSTAASTARTNAPLTAPPAASGFIAPGLIREVRTGTFAAEPSPSAPEIHLRAGYTFAPKLGDPTAGIPGSLRAASADGPERALVQFHGPILPEDLDLIRSHGGRIEFYVPDYTFLVTFAAGRSPADHSATGDAAKGDAAKGDAAGSGAVHALLAEPRVLWVGPYHPAYKISPAVTATDADRESSGRPTGNPRDLLVLLFPDSRVPTASAELARLGAEIVETSSNGINNLIRLRINPASIPEIARRNDVAWIEPYETPRLNNDQCQWVVQTNHPQDRRLWDLGLRGQGQIVSITDSGIRTTHRMFKDPNLPLTDFGDYPLHRKIVAYFRAVSNPNIAFGDELIQGFHGTHTSGTLAGDDSPLGSDPRDGMAKEARIYFLDGGTPSDESILIPLDLNDLFRGPYEGNSAGAARIMSNSWGVSTQGAYDVLSMTADQFMHDHPDFLPFFSNGNDSRAGTVGSPATAKSVVSVGGTLNGNAANVLYSTTSRGPAADGRWKPTLCAPGSSISSASGGGDSSYVTLSGTSMACPAAAGTAVLVRQYLTEGWYPTGAKVPGNSIADPSAALVKAMLIASTDPNFPGLSVPSNDIGWGRVEADQSCYFAGDDIRLALIDNTEGLLTGESIEYEVLVTDTSVPVRATLVWTDVAGTPAASIELVNDLDLIASDGVIEYNGNAFQGGQSVAGGARDRRNVEECIRRNAPRSGLWTFRVEGTNVPLGPQPFAIVITGGLGETAGVVALDQPTYNGNDLVQIRLVDTNANGPISVLATSPTEPDGEPVILTGADGVFSGTIRLTLDETAAGDGKLSVSDGDEIRIVYDDEDPIGARGADARVDLEPPVISHVEPLTVAESEILVTWDTDTPSNSQVFFGSTPELEAGSVREEDLVVRHEVLLRGLQPNTLYFYDVLSRDRQGNEVRDDDAGRHYRVATDFNRDILLVIGDETFPNEQTYRDALDALGWTYSVWTGSAAAFPLVGNRTRGMASYKSILWQTGFEQYPQFSDAQRDSISELNLRGSRIALHSHDTAWDFSDPSSPDYTPERRRWVQREFKALFQNDPATWDLLTGTEGDPVSGPYVAGLPYTPFRSGGAGDEVAGIDSGGVSVSAWKNSDATPATVGIRWTGDTPVGNPATAQWGGAPRKVASSFFEWSRISAGVPEDPSRSFVLDRTLAWLIGHSHPTVRLLAPNGGETITDPLVSITWSEQADSGLAIAAKRIYYSDNGGRSWNLITDQAGSSPYSWNVGTVVNGDQYRVRVVIVDTGIPPLSAVDASDTNFSLARPGGDIVGPVILAGSVKIDPDPALTTRSAVLSAMVTDERTGDSNIAAAEWSAGANAAPSGEGTPMNGDFGDKSVNVSASLDGIGLPHPEATLWVRARDSAGNWGSARSVSFRVNSSEVPLPQFAFLGSRPNPFAVSTNIEYALAAITPVRIEVFDLSGRRIRTILDRSEGPGPHQAAWDGTDEVGRQAASGVYFYRFQAGTYTATRKLVRLK